MYIPVNKELAVSSMYVHVHTYILLMICRPVANYRQIGRYVPTGGFLGVMQLQKKKRSKTAFVIPMYFNKGSF